MENLALYLAAFLMGSVPFGILVARAFDVKDLQGQGSGNIGATNVARVAGFWPAGFLTFLFDFLKGLIPVVVVGLPAFQAWWTELFHGSVSISANTIWMTGLSAVLGHCFSPWIRFKGGKGVATGLGVVAFLAPIAALVGVCAFALCFLKTRVGSLSSITALVTAAVVELTIQPTLNYGAYLWIGAAIIFLILFRHESNFDSLLEDRERKF